MDERPNQNTSDAPARNTNRSSLFIFNELKLKSSITEDIRMNTIEVSFERKEIEPIKAILESTEFEGENAEEETVKSIRRRYLQ